MIAILLLAGMTCRITQHVHTVIRPNIDTEVVTISPVDVRTTYLIARGHLWTRGLATATLHTSTSVLFARRVPHRRISAWVQVVECHA